MSNGYVLADTNSLVYAYRAGGSELLDQYIKLATEGDRQFAITRTVLDEIEDGPLRAELGQYLADRNIPTLSAPETEERLRAGTLSPKSAGEVSMLEVATREQEAGRITRIWSDDKYFDSPQIMRDHPDVHRSMSANMLDEAYEQRFIDNGEYKAFRDGYEAQAEFRPGESPRLNTFQYDLPSSEIDAPHHVRPTHIHAGRALGIVGLALDAYDAAESVRTANRLRGEGNDTAAESALIHFGTRTVGGFAGAGLGFMGGAALGVETGPGLFVTGAIGGIAGVFAGDKIAEWTDNRRIYNQDDRQGNTWTYDPENPALGWQRRVPIDASNDNIDNPTRGTLRASPALANELNYKSSTVSVELVLGGPPPQRDPFVQPANASDSPSMAPADWTRDADSGDWQRTVVLGYGGHGPVPTRLETANPERALELDRAAAQTVLQNAANSPAAIAARYEDTYIRNGWAAYGPIPDAVRNARTDVDTLVASDENRYQRGADGEWISTGLIYNSTATGNLRDELDATREVLLARLPPPQPIPAPPPMTDDARLRDTVMGAYANAGVTPSPERIEASMIAVRETMTANGLDPNTTALSLRPNADGRYDQDSPIASMRLEPDGRTYAIAAITTTEDIQRAHAGAPTITTPTATPERPVEPARDGAAPPSRDDAALRLDDTAHPHHAMFSTLLDTVHARDRALGRTPDDASLQLAGGLTAEARARGLDTIGFAAFTPDGTKVAMANSTDPNTPWARTAVGNVGELVNQPLAHSSEQIAKLDQPLPLTQPVQGALAPQEETAGRSTRMA